MKKLLALGILLLLAGTFLATFADRLQGQEKQPTKEEKLKALLKHVKDKNESVRLQAVEALADYGPEAKAAIPDLVNALSVKNEDLRLNAAITLGKMGAKAKSAAKALRAAAKDEDESVRAAAREALEKVTGEKE